MPRAGWCRDCGEWVWVDENGACQNGHGADCVESVHEQPDPSSPPPPEPESDFGRGEVPLELRRFNWGAFFLPFFWGIWYRSWPVMTAWFVAVTSPVLIVAFTGATQGGKLTNLVAAAIFSEIASGVCRLWAGLNANAGLWRRDGVMREMLPSYRPKYSTQTFRTRQRTWTLVGAIVAGLSAVAVAPFEAQMWQEYGLTYVGAVMPAVWLGAEVLLALWLDVRLRKDPPDLGERAHDLV